MSDQEFDLPEPMHVSKKRGAIAIGVVVLVLAGAFAAGALPRWRAKERLAAKTAERAGALPRVELVAPSSVAGGHELVLTGSIEPLEQTVIHARATGYLKRWLVDLGDRVEEGQLLAEIDTPELDARLAQAQAQLAQAKADVARALANHSYSKTNLDRYRRLTPAGVSSQQDLERQEAQSEVDEANVAVARANVAAAQANVERLAQLRRFSRVTAPFAGTIIARTAQRGELVNAGASPLFELAVVDTVRLLIDVPQDVAPDVTVGVAADVHVREFPGRAFAGTIARSAGALDSRSRTMPVEIRLPNADGKLLPGMYASVALALSAPRDLYEIPVTALFSDAQGTRVAVVGADGRIAMRKIVIARDTGRTLQIASGLDGTERIVKLSSAALDDGERVEVVTPAALGKGDERSGCASC